MKKLYHILALLALINLFALAGFVGYLFTSGRLDRERVEQIGVVLRGEFPTSQPATQPAEAPPPPPEPSRAELERMQAQREYYNLVAQRHQRELDDRRSLNERIQLEVVQKLEEIERKRAQLEQQQKALAVQGEDEGFARTLEMFSNMDPALAKNLLKDQTKDPDVVKILMQMEPARAKKIVNTCKTPEEMLWIGRILTQIRKQDPGSGVDGPKPASSGG